MLSPTPKANTSNSAAPAGVRNVFRRFLPGLILLLAILLAVSGYALYGRYRTLTAELAAARAVADTTTLNRKILAFTKLFVDTVLNASQEVSFEDRLRLETAVRDLGNDDVLAAWQRFVGSASETDAQREVRNLLTVLLGALSAR